MISLLYSLLLLAASGPFATAASDKPLKPCTVISPTSERFFDLNPMRRVPPSESDAKKSSKKEGEEGSWHARGYDYNANFTINFCGPVVEELDKVQDLDKGLWQNVSAFYEKGDKQWAIGLENSEPIFRGRKLILNYTGGSLCPSLSSKSKRALEPTSLDTREIIDGDDDDDDRHDGDKKKPSKSVERRKTTIISLLCDSDPLAKTSVSFVAAVDDCSYFFEGRSPFACGGVHQDTQALGPGGVFGVIVLIAVLVYFAGGCVYQRTVMHQRGWRQLPNYAMWAGIWRFFSDMFVILTSSCARFMPSRRGYSRVSLGQDSGRRGRRNEDEDRLIDNLDEEWDD